MYEGVAPVLGNNFVGLIGAYGYGWLGESFKTKLEIKLILSLKKFKKENQLIFLLISKMVLVMYMLEYQKHLKIQIR